MSLIADETATQIFTQLDAVDIATKSYEAQRATLKACKEHLDEMQAELNSMLAAARAGQTPLFDGGK